jgi:hypothetical protein
VGQKFNKLDELHREVAERRAGRDQAASETKIRAEYSRLGRDPVYAAGDIPISPDLVDLLHDPQTA